MVFGLIGLLGLVALFVAVRHGIHQHQAGHQDVVLGVVGLLCFVIGCSQAWRLVRE